MDTTALVLGLLNGLTIGLLAVGLVLVYKANRFLNLAHAQLGSLSALLLAKLVLDAGWNWWAALFVAVSIGVITGIAVERFIIGPMRRRSSSGVRLLLLSLAVSQVLLALAYIPALTPSPDHPPIYPQPFSGRVEVGGVSLAGMSVITAIVVPVLVAALTLVLRYTLLGAQVRAAASNPDAARLAGISLNRVSTIVWAVAGAFAAVSAVLQAPSQGSFNASTLGPYLLMLTLGAAAFGAFVSIPGALVGGLVLGLTSQLVSAATANASKGLLAVFVLILGIVLVRGRAIAQVFALSGGVGEDLPVLRVPEALRKSPLVRHQRLLVGGPALLVALVLPQLPGLSTPGKQFQLSLVLIYAVLGISLTMLLGWGGQVSLGHFALVGIGAYITARLSHHGWTLPGLFLLVGLVGAMVSVLIGLPALRVRGLTLAVTTLGFAVVASQWLFFQPFLASDKPFGVFVEPVPLGAGLPVPTSRAAVYYVALGTVVLAVLAAGALRRSGPGRLTVAVRDNERASASFGVNPASTKLALLAVSGAFAGVAGVLWAIAWESVTPSQFTPNLSLAVIAIPVVGGMGSVGGAVAAAVLLYGGTYVLGPLTSTVFGDFGNNLAFLLMFAGLSQIAVLLQWPAGIAGAVQKRWETILQKRADRPSEVLVGDVATALKVADVRVRFGGNVALDGPDIEVRPGEIVGLIGTNGAGKTTLMNVISGVIAPESGSVRVFGREVVDLPPDFRAAFGMARSFQDATLFAGLTVLETIQVSMAQHRKVGVLSSMVVAPWVRLSERRSRLAAEAIVERFGLGPYAHTRTAELSTGTRRICDLAAQVASGPKLLLLDEPTAGVAQREAEAFGPLLRKVRDELDCAVLIVEHDMPLLMGLCDRVYALEAGRVIAEGTPEQVRHDPRVVASYLGTSEIAIGRSGSTNSSGGSAGSGGSPPAQRPPRAPRKPATPTRTRPRRQTGGQETAKDLVARTARPTESGL